MGKRRMSGRIYSAGSQLAFMEMIDPKMACWRARHTAESKLDGTDDVQVGGLHKRLGRSPMDPRPCVGQR